MTTLRTAVSYRFISLVMSQDGGEALDAIEAMSRENATDDAGPWRAALASLTDRDVGPDEWRAVFGSKLLFIWHAGADNQVIRTMELRRRRSFVEAFSDGDRPADLADEEIDDAAESFEHRAARRTPEGQALAWRAIGIYYFGCGVRETHRDVHRALSGGETTGPTIGGCPWCKEATR